MSDSDFIKAMLLDSLERGTQTVEELEQSVALGQSLQALGLCGNDERSQATIAALETWQRWQEGDVA